MQSKLPTTFCDVLNFSCEPSSPTKRTCFADMRGKSRKRTNYFKLGTRGRRGRVAYDARWGHTYPQRLGERDNTRSSLAKDTISTIDDDAGVDEVMDDINISAYCEKDSQRQEGSPPQVQAGTATAKQLGLGVTTVRVNPPGNSEEGSLIDLLDAACVSTTDAVVPASDEESLVDEALSLFGDEQMYDDFSGDDAAPAEVQQGEDEGSNPQYTPLPVSDKVSLSGAVIKTCFRKLTTWQNLLSVIVVTGSVRFSVEQFQLFRAVINSLLEARFLGEPHLPAYSTIKRTLVPCLSSWGFVHSEIMTAKLESGKEAHGEVSSGMLRAGKIVVIKPSSWSTMDVQCPQTWEQLKYASRKVEEECGQMQFQHIETSPIVRGRKAFLNILSLLPGTALDNGHFCASHYTHSHDYLYDISFPGHARFPEAILRSVVTSVRKDIGVSSLAARPVRSSLVQQELPRSELSETTLSELSLGKSSFLSSAVSGLWFLGDVCTLMRIATNARYMLVLVHHQARPGRFSSRMELVSVPYAMGGSDEEEPCLLNWKGARKSRVTDVKLRGSHSATGHLDVFNAPWNKIPVLKSYGRLENGMRYFIDHILLYSDGFSQYNFKKGSSGGVYSLSLNYEPHMRRTRERVRVLTLTPPGVSTSEGIRSVIPDLVQSSTEGMLVRNADGEDMLLFTNIVGYVGDYHEVGAVLDIVGQNGYAPCHLCSFLQFKAHHSTASRFGYTSLTHSGDVCYARMGARTLALRHSDMPDNDLVRLGLNPKQRAVMKDIPLLELYNALQKAMRNCVIPLTEESVPVVNPSFDPYRSVFVAPDHLLAGIAINEVTLAFKSLPNNRRRKQAESMICHFLRYNGLIEESKIFNYGESALYTRSISATFCLLAVSGPVFSEIVENISSSDDGDDGGDDGHAFLFEVINNLDFFRRLVGKTYWYPRPDLDDPHSVSGFNQESGTSHITSLQRTCREYMRRCNEICKKSITASVVLDKTNLHRLLELYFHSIPAAGHIHHFAELVFECAHQPLKAAMSKSNFRDSHLQSTNHCIGDDWKSRLAAAYAIDRDEESTANGTSSLLNVLCGRQDDVLSYVKDDPNLEDKMLKILQNGIIKEVVGKRPSYLERPNVSSEWYLSNPYNNGAHSDDYEASRSRSLRESSCLIEKLMIDYVVDIMDGFPKFYEKARRVKVGGSGESQCHSHAYGHDTLTRDTVVQVLLHDIKSVILEPFQRAIADTSTAPGHEATTLPSVYYFVIESLAYASHNKIYAAVRMCRKTESTMLRLDDRSKVQLLELSGCVRRTGLIHACEQDPTQRCIDRDGTSVTCTGSMLNGNTFYLISREEGYPPRLA